MKIKFYLFSLLALLMLVMNASASHLMGGDITYTFTSYNPNTNLYTYSIRTEIYRYCDSTSGTTPAQLDQSITLGVYSQNPTLPNANKSLYTTLTLQLSSSNYITPPSTNPNCHIGTAVCVQQGIYTASISLPPSTGGYHLIYDRCCRNANITNLNVAVPPGSGEAYYAFIPPTSVRNNSPSFATAPVPYLCVADTVSVLNSAFDADGDSLVYSFVVPYNGISSSNTPTPTPPNTYTWPIPSVTYVNANFNVNAPFGTGGYASINPVTGLTSYYVPTQGFYVVAVEIREYRNGILIGVTRRDIQLIVIPCTANNAPALSTTGGSGSTSHTVDGGGNLCFPINYTDQNGDSVFVSVSSPIFNSTVTNPAATFTSTAGSGSGGGQFCWTTPCVRTAATYQFVATATDNGCPPKSTNTVYTINVNPIQISGLNGAMAVCSNQGPTTYSVSSNGSSYFWYAQGGTIIGSNTTSSVNVQWSSSSTGIGVYAVNSNGCHSDTLLMPVSAITPLVQAGADVNICSGGSATLGSPAIPGQTYSWAPINGLSDPTVSDPTVSLINTGNNPQTTMYVVTTTLSGCTTTDTVEVTTNPLPHITFAQVPEVCADAPALALNFATPAGGTYSGNGVSNNMFYASIAGIGTSAIDYEVTNQFGCSASSSTAIVVNPNPIVSVTGDDTVCASQSSYTYTAISSGNTFAWNVAGGSILNPGSSATTTVQWISSTGTISVIAIDSTGCSSLPADIQITQFNPMVDAGPDVTFCSGASVQLGGMTMPGQSYSWSPSAGLSDPTSADPSVTLSNPGTSIQTETYTVTTTYLGCTNSDDVTITVHPLPVISFNLVPSLCETASPLTLAFAQPAGGAYSGNGIASGSFDPTVAGVGNSVVVYDYTDQFGCSSTDSTAITVNPNPVVTITGSDTVCTSQASYTYLAASSGSIFNWTVIGGSVANPGTGSSIDVKWNTSGTVSVIATDSNGCSSTPASIAATLFNPAVDAGADVRFCSGTSAAIGSSGNTGQTYSWNPTGGLSSPTSSATSITLLNNGTAALQQDYILTTSQYGCTNSDTVHLTVDPLPVVSAGTLPSLCQSSAPVTLTSGSPAGGTYTGAGVNNNNFDPASAGVGTWNILYSYRDGNGCLNSASGPLTVHANPTPTLSGFSTACVNGSPVPLSGGNPTGGAYSGTGVSNGYFDPSALPSGNYTITYTYTDGNGCTGSTTAAITVGVPPSVTVTGGQSFSCKNNTIYIGYGPQYITLTATASAGGLSYQWYKDGVLIPGATGTTYDATGGGMYSVSVSDGNGCSSSPNASASMITINAVDVRCGQNLQKVVLCHVPPGNPANPQTLCIAPSAVPAHLSNHPGDCLGPCPNSRVNGSDLDEAHSLAVYPNPFNSSLNISFELYADQIIEIGIYDLEGRLIIPLLEEPMHGDTHFYHEFNVSSLAKGIYIVRFASGDVIEYRKVNKNY